jgi:hypothetical protein
MTGPTRECHQLRAAFLAEAGGVIVRELTARAFLAEPSRRELPTGLLGARSMRSPFTPLCKFFCLEQPTANSAEASESQVALALWAYVAIGRRPSVRSANRRRHEVPGVTWSTEFVPFPVPVVTKSGPW